MGFPVSTRSTDDLITAAIWNADIVSNLNNSVMHLLARKTSDENVTTTTLQDDDTLVTPSIGTNEVWQLRLLLSVITGAGGMKSSFSVPTSGDLQMTLLGLDSASAAVQQKRLTASDGDTVSYLANWTTGRLYIMDVLYINAGTAGVVTFRNALTSASGTSTVKAQSTLWGVRLV